jgi:ribose 5-phosphate isomerase B
MTFDPLHIPSSHLVFASDHGGQALKNLLLEHLTNEVSPIPEKKWIPLDLDPVENDPSHYPDRASLVIMYLKAHPGSRGVLICGSGIGMSMVANRHEHIRAALCHEPLSTQYARRHNNANVLCLGGRLIGFEMAKACLETFMNTSFDGGRHELRISKFSKAESF